MLIDNIKTGDRIEIALKSKGRSDKIFLSQVEAVIDKSKILIHAPIEKGQLLKLPKEVTYTVLFIADKGMYQFDAEVTDYLKVDGFSLLSIKLTSPGERVQRREFFRFDCSIPVGFAVINESGEQTEAGLKQGIIRDIGGGGMRLLAKDIIPIKVLIRASLMLEEDYIMIFGQVLHRENSPNDAYPYQYRVKFTAMSNTEQEKIIQFIYNQQRKALRKQR